MQGKLGGWVSNGQRYGELHLNHLSMSVSDATELRDKLDKAIKEAV